MSGIIEVFGDHSHVIWEPWRLTHRYSYCLFNSLFGLTPQKASVLLITCHLWGNSDGDQWMLLTKGQACSCHNVIIVWRARGLDSDSLATPTTKFYNGCSNVANDAVYFDVMNCFDRELHEMRDNCTRYHYQKPWKLTIMGKNKVLSGTGSIILNYEKQIQKPVLAFMAMGMGNIELMVKLQVFTYIHDQCVVHRQFTPDT